MQDSFEITQTSEAAGIELSRLRNWLRQGVVKYCGEEPRPSYPRMFPLAGVYEIALVRELVDSGFERGFAVRLVQPKIDEWQRLVSGEDIGTILKSAYKHTQRILTEYRNLEKPALWVFGAEDHNPDRIEPTLPRYAQGFEDVPKCIAELLKDGKLYLLPTVKRGDPPTEMKPGQPFHAFGIVNVTAVLARVDSVLSKF
jgi:hypothetical protein